MAELTVPVSVSGGVATVGALPAQEISEAAATPGVTTLSLDLTTGGAADSALLPAESLKLLTDTLESVENDIAEVELKLSSAELVLDENVLSSISEQAGGAEMTMAAKPISAGDLSDGQREALGGRTVFAGLALRFSAGGNEISSFKGGRLTVNIPFTAPADGGAFSVFYVADGGAFRHATSIGKDGASFRVAHLSDFVVASDESVTFYDVVDGAWYSDVAYFAARSGFMMGDGTGSFAPAETVSRAMLAQILYNMEGAPDAASAGFTDVDDAAWYAAAVNWAAENGVISGVGGQRFDPLTEVTREQAAQMLYNYAKYKGNSLDNSKPLTAFTDAGTSSGWAQEALSWAVGEKLISGKGGGILAPLASATRAEIAKIMTYYLESYEL
ncbi:MAG: S-layer homology domain-containing protein [Oscillospiraceae bacterium]|nr:S-layer homology domain-containing protein [Oscillospiraceae bacterium]